ncbi:hypothetical protein F862_gp106 [Vibrio phage vB_VpaS_MAR10]|uniref:Uncharacterized protein n=1 Tax=Vibrio phage vB_VpaS_MAR10 TaxID=1229755 RepID=K7R9J0_9CAUD|nr:hypothetical protein F862_gp106 [Vibrio phage vB_VpaS_MAR10]AFV81338.1 hypothetical protein MAR10_103 [Vibrio phage vB_VpaS_MAR10]
MAIRGISQTEIASYNDMIALIENGKHSKARELFCDWDQSKQSRFIRALGDLEGVTLEVHLEILKQLIVLYV